MTHNKTIDCRTAREWMDRLNPLSDEEEQMFQDHLISCPGCAVEADIEYRLRTIIAPPTLPTPSDRFEENLAMALGLRRSPVRSILNILSAYWGWIAVSLTAIIFIIPYLQGLETWSRSLWLLWDTAKMATGYLDQMATPFVPSLPDFGTIGSSFSASLILNVILGVIVLVSGVFAIRLTWEK